VWCDIGKEVTMASYLMVPGDKEKFLAKIDELNCDFAIVNLEDGVFDKTKALELVVDFFKSNKIKKNIIFRVNPISESGLDEIIKLQELNPYAIRVAKIKSKNEVKKILKYLNYNIELHLSLETKEAFDDISKLKVSNQVTTLYLGILDLLNSLNLPQNLLRLDNPTIHYMLSKFLIDSKIAGFIPVGFVYQDYKDLDTFKKWCKFEKALGFNHKVAISPSQVEIINEVFKVDEDELKRAKYIIEKFEQMKTKGISGFSDEKYGFIDEPIYKDAKLNDLV